MVAAQQGNILATAFHPELTTDTRWHRYFLSMVDAYAAAAAAAAAVGGGVGARGGSDELPPTPPFPSS